MAGKRLSPCDEYRGRHSERSQAEGRLPSEEERWWKDVRSGGCKECGYALSLFRRNVAISMSQFG